MKNPIDKLIRHPLRTLAGVFLAGMAIGAGLTAAKDKVQEHQQKKSWFSWAN